MSEKVKAPGTYNPATECACGRPLHYSSSTDEAAMKEVIRLAGDQFVRLVLHGRDTTRTFLVQRHYAALHGLKGKAVADLGFAEVEA